MELRSSSCKSTAVDYSSILMRAMTSTSRLHGYLFLASIYFGMKGSCSMERVVLMI